MFNSARSRRWLFGVAAAAALSSIIWFIAQPGHWHRAEIAPTDGAAIAPDTAIATDAAADAVADEYANAPTYEDAKAAASEDIKPAVDQANQPASVSDDARDAASSVAD